MAQNADTNLEVVVNDELQLIEPGSSLEDLLQKSGLVAARVAIELNREVVSRQMWKHTILKQGDRLEIVHFVGGG